MTQLETSRVNVNCSANVQQGSPLPYPLNKVLGLMPREESAWKAIGELRSRGVAEQEMELWGGPDASKKLEESFSGIRGGIQQLSLDLAFPGDEYFEALRNGEFLLVVPVSEDVPKEGISESMVKNGCRYIAYYDNLTVEVLAY